MPPPIPIPDDVRGWLRQVFADCNARVAKTISDMPTTHEVALDMTFIQHFIGLAAPCTHPMYIEGTITRDIDGRRSEIPFYIDTLTGTWSQWGHNTMTLGENVDVLEALRDAACDIARHCVFCGPASLPTGLGRAPLFSSSTGDAGAPRATAEPAT
jgi:hypothetical protein